MADEDKEGVVKGSDPDARGPQKGHTTNTQAEIEPQFDFDDETAVREVNVEVLHIDEENRRAAVNFMHDAGEDEGEVEVASTIPLDQIKDGDKLKPGKKKLVISNGAYTQAVIDSHPHLTDPPPLNDEGEPAEPPARDEQEESERRQAERQREIDEGEDQDDEADKPSEPKTL